MKSPSRRDEGEGRGCREREQRGEDTVGDREGWLENCLAGRAVRDGKDMDAVGRAGRRERGGLEGD